MRSENIAQYEGACSVRSFFYFIHISVRSVCAVCAQCVRSVRAVCAQGVCSVHSVCAVNPILCAVYIVCTFFFLTAQHYAHIYPSVTPPVSSK